VPPTNLKAKFDALFGRDMYAYDGAKLLWYAGSNAVVISQQAAAEGWHGADDRNSGMACPLSVNFGKGETTLTVKCNEKTVELGTEIPTQDQINVLSAITQNTSKRLFMPIGSAFFAERSENAYRWAERKPIGRDRELLLHLGYSSSIVHAERGALLQVDHAACVMLNDVSLLDFLANKMGQSAERIDVGSSESSRALRSLKNKRLKATHKPNRTYQLFGVDDVPIAARTFDHEGATTNVYEFFKAEYPRIDPKKPGITVGKARQPGGVAPVIPIELLKIAPGQPSIKKSSEISQMMIKEMCKDSQARFSKIEDILGTVKQTETSAQGFGLEISSSLLKLAPESARRLETCELTFGMGSRVRVDDKGGWSLRGNRGDIPFYRPAKVDRWAVVHFGCRDLDLLADFIGIFCRMARERGIKGLEPESLVNPTSGRLDRAGRGRFRVLDMGKDTVDSLEGSLNQMASEYQRNLSFVLFILPEVESVNRVWMYPAVKRWAATSEYGVVTQCVQWPKMAGGGKGGGKGGGGCLALSQQYAAGVLLRVNMKLGGANGILERSLFQVPGTMVIGVDVNHAKPGSVQNSFAAVVATLDKDATKFHTEILVQEARQERLEQIGEVMKTLYRVWQQHNKIGLTYDPSAPTCLPPLTVVATRECDHVRSCFPTSIVADVSFSTATASPTRSSTPSPFLRFKT